jgi:hypothetical protein
MWLAHEDDDPFDATVSVYRLTPVGAYGLALTRKLSHLEAA